MLFPLPQNRSIADRVVVTGAGIVTSLGLGWRLNADGFRIGKKAFRPVTLFDVSRQRARIAAEAELPSELPNTQLSRNRIRRLDRATRMLLFAAHEAWMESGWSPGGRIPLVLGTTGGGMALGESYLFNAIRAPRARKSQAVRLVNYQAQRQALDVCDAFGFSGPITTVSNACASGANAIGHAWELIRRGQAERVLTGGHDALCQLIYAGFDSLQALSTSPCLPFDASHSGLTLGEGAAVLALESLPYARARNAPILGEVIGYGASNDIHHMTQPHPRGDAALASMTCACRIAQITPDQVDYVNAHGTGTLHNDVTEAEAINRWSNGRSAALPVSSTKASIGHLLGAAGAVEAIVALMVLREKFLPPETGLTTPDEGHRFSLVRQPAEMDAQVVLSNSLGFGGSNASLILRRWP